MLNKIDIINLYFVEKISVKDIAHKLMKSKTSIFNILKADARYEMEKTLRENNEALRIEEQLKEIQFLFFQQGKKVIEISSELAVSMSTVSNAIKADKKRYEEEKQRRKLVSRERNKQQTKEIINLTRNQIKSKLKDDIGVMESLALLQKQNAISMSRITKVSDSMMVKSNLNHYKYNHERKRLEFDESCGARPYDMPRSIGIHTIKK